MGYGQRFKIAIKILPKNQNFRLVDSCFLLCMACRTMSEMHTPSVSNHYVEILPPIPAEVVKDQREALTEPRLEFRDKETSVRSALVFQSVTTEEASRQSPINSDKFLTQALASPFVWAKDLSTQSNIDRAVIILNDNRDLLLQCCAYIKSTRNALPEGKKAKFFLQILQKYPDLFELIEPIVESQTVLAELEILQIQFKLEEKQIAKRGESTNEVVEVAGNKAGYKLMLSNLFGKIESNYELSRRNLEVFLEQQIQISTNAIPDEINIEILSETIRDINLNKIRETIRKNLVPKKLTIGTLRQGPNEALEFLLNNLEPEPPNFTDVLKRYFTYVGVVCFLGLIAMEIAYSPIGK
jgi:hypothetical protein